MVVKVQASRMHDVATARLREATFNPTGRSYDIYQATPNENGEKERKRERERGRERERESERERERNGTCFAFADTIDALMCHEGVDCVSAKAKQA